MTESVYTPFWRAALTVCDTAEHADGAVLELQEWIADRARVRIHTLRGIAVAPWWRLDLWAQLKLEGHRRAGGPTAPAWLAWGDLPDDDLQALADAADLAALAGDVM